jgi:rhodanese-related sulfurtransferase
MVDAATLKTWLDTGEAVLVDVREPAEHAAEHIPAATLLPLGKACLGALPCASGKKLVLHCRKGGRGTSACEKLLAEDPSLELYNLDGGIEAWRAAGFEVARTGKPMLPLDRQVQLAIGILLITATVLGYFVSSTFFVLPGLIGVGLSIAGMTGFCGLALLLAKMPWNQRTGKAPSCCMVR